MITCIVMAGWVADTGAASIRVRVVASSSHGSPKQPAPRTHGLQALAVDSDDYSVFRASFRTADSLAEALQQPCWRVGLGCRVEDESDGKAVVVQRLDTSFQSCDTATD